MIKSFLGKSCMRLRFFLFVPIKLFQIIQKLFSIPVILFALVLPDLSGHFNGICGCFSFHTFNIKTSRGLLISIIEKPCFRFTLGYFMSSLKPVAIHTSLF